MASPKWVRPNWFMGRRSDAPIGIRRDEMQELDGHPVPGEKAELQLDAVELYQRIDERPHLPVRLPSGEAQRLRIEPQRSVEVRHADPDVCEKLHRHSRSHPFSPCFLWKKLQS